MVPVAVGEDDVFDGGRRQAPQRRDGLARRLHGGAGVDGDDAGGRDDERDVREVVPLRHVDAVGLSHHLPVAEAEPAHAVDGDVDDHAGIGGVVHRRQPGALEHLLRAPGLAERPVGGREPSVDSAVDAERDVEPRVQRGLEVRDRLARLAEARREIREDQAAPEAPHPRVGGRAFVELADRVLDPRHASQEGDVAGDARLHDRLQGAEERAPARLLLCQPPEIGVALPLLVRRLQLLHRRQHDPRVGVGIRRHLEQRGERPRLGDRAGLDRRDAPAGPEQTEQNHEAEEPEHDEPPLHLDSVKIAVI